MSSFVVTENYRDDRSAHRPRGGRPQPDRRDPTGIFRIRGRAALKGGCAFLLWQVSCGRVDCQAARIALKGPEVELMLVDAGCVVERLAHPRKHGSIYGRHDGPWSPSTTL